MHPKISNIACLNRMYVVVQFLPIMLLSMTAVDPGIDVQAGEDQYRYSLALAALHEGDILKWLIDTKLV